MYVLQPLLRRLRGRPLVAGPNRTHGSPSPSSKPEVWLAKKTAMRGVHHFVWFLEEDYWWDSGGSKREKEVGFLEKRRREGELLRTDLREKVGGKRETC